MGGKQIRTGKHLLFYFAGLIFLFLCGCALLEKIQEPASSAISPAEKGKNVKKDAAALEEKNKEEAARGYLLKGRKFFTQGNFEEAFSENQIIVAFYPGKSPMEEALFMLGLIYLHPDNPTKNFGKAQDMMKRVVKEYPNGLFVQQAKAWIGLLLINEKASREQEKLAKEQEKLIKEQEKLIRDHERLMREHEKVSKMLEEYKKVDIDIEGKKREKGR